MYQNSTNREFGQGRSNADEVNVRDALHVFLEAGSVAELRVPGTHRGTVSGYFDDFGRLALTAARFSGTAPTIYDFLEKWVFYKLTDKGKAEEEAWQDPVRAAHPEFG